MSIIITEEMEELASRLVPAIRHRETGKITSGSRGDYHAQLLQKNHPEYTFSGTLHPDALNIMRKYDRGFYNTKNKEFLTRDEASDRAGVLDSQDLVSHKHIQGRGSKVAMFREGKRIKIKSFKNFLKEGNPLSRVYSSDRHSVLISAERKGLSPEENKSRMNALKKEWRNRGFGYRNTRGKWDEGGGVGSENSLHVFAKGTSKDDAAELRHHARQLSTQFDQDAFIHRTPKGKGTAIYTGTSKKGKKEDFGDTRYNVDNPYGETEFKIRKPEGKRPKITFIPKD